MKHNFYAGPSILPQEVFEEAAQGVKNFEGIGLSILEISHRSKEFVSVLDEAVALTTELLKVPDSHSVLFLSGGASSQFFMAPMNLLNENEKAAYIDTGSWSAKAIKEAKLYGEIDVIASSKEKNYTYIPKDYEIDPDTKYVHYTSNNTIFGTQFQTPPDVNVPLISDMSSDIFSRAIDISKYALIYAGAQKNMGPAGVTLVIVQNDLLGKVSRSLTSMLDYQTHIAKNSSFNTPPVFPIYVSMLNLRWLKKNGGVAAAQERNQAKSTLIYDTIDQLSLFEGVAASEDRSAMNATFTMAEESLSEEFLNACNAADCIGVKGHRSVGGFRASMYNAMKLESVEVLCDVMNEFEEKHA